MKFILRTLRDKQRALKFITEKCMSEPVMSVTVAEHKTTRSVEANARHWALLTAVSNFMPSVMDGVYYSPEMWHAFFCKKYLGFEVMQYGHDVLVIPKRSRKLSIGEFHDLDAQIEAELATEYGWTFEQEAA